jgi:hypothetical protein
VAAAILAASECGFQPHTVCQRGGRVKLRPGISDLGSGRNLLVGRAVLCAPVFPMAMLKRGGQRSARPTLIRVHPWFSFLQRFRNTLPCCCNRSSSRFVQSQLLHAHSRHRERVVEDGQIDDFRFGMVGSFIVLRCDS